LVASYDLRPGNRAGLFSKEKTSKGLECKQANDVYSTEVNK